MRDRQFVPALLMKERVRRGLSLAEVARLSGLNRKTPGLLERGTHIPSDLTVAKVAAGIGCTVKDLSRPRAKPARIEQAA